MVFKEICSSNKINKSCSESDLNKVNGVWSSIQDRYTGFERKPPYVTRKVLYVEEVFSCDSPKLSKKEACYQIIGQSTPDHLHNLEHLFASSVVLSNDVSNKSMFTSNIDGEFDRDLMNKTDYLNDDYYIDDVVPMDVDTSQNGSKINSVDLTHMDIDVDARNCNSEFGSLDNIRDNMVKKRNLCRQQSDPTDTSSISQKSQNRTRIIHINSTKKKRPSCSTCILPLTLLLLLPISYLLFFNFKSVLTVISVNSDIQRSLIQRDLVDKVHGQKASINVVVRSLQERKNWKCKIKVLSFVGSTGTGKTFIANILKSHFPNELIHELYGVQLHYKTEHEKILSDLSSYNLNLVIVDDIKRGDITDLLALIHSLPKDLFILVVPIFNIQYTDSELNHTINYGDIIEIRDEFDSSGLYHELILFNMFNDEQVKDWLVKQLTLRNIDVNLYDKILTRVLDGHDVKYNGLKGLHSKMLLELEKYNY